MERMTHHIVVCLYPEEREQIEKLLPITDELGYKRFESISHFIRCAICQQIRELRTGGKRKNGDA